METKKIDKYTYKVEPTGQMKVPLKVFVSEKMLPKLLEDNALQQGANVAVLPGIQKQSIMMPDAHQGYGFPIGGVAAFDAEKGCISPGGIGYDINCGVRLLTTPLSKDEIEPKIRELLESMFRNIPVGVGSTSSLRVSEAELDEILNTGTKWALRRGYATEEDLAHCEEGGSMESARADRVSNKAKQRGKKQIGTLGAGNHFIEVQYVDKIYDPDIARVFGIDHEGRIMVMIHTGSRGLGHQVCTDYLRRMEEELPQILLGLPDRELIYAPLGTKLAEDYFAAMSAAANFGWVNRQLIAYHVRKSFQEVFGGGIKLGMVYDVAHNIAKLEEHKIDGKRKSVYVHRKGATRAFGPGHPDVPEAYRKVGQPILLPGSMGTASYILVGTDKAAAETFASTPHGAGRALSRHAALKKFRGSQVKEDMEKANIYIKAGSMKGIAEEAPGVYKDIDDVAEVTAGAAIGRLVSRHRPMGVIKG
ncbi:MAG: RtcB family protein [bacterium]|nr:RtcB family protein [bacterium]